MQLQRAVKNVFDQLISSLDLLTPDQYVQKSKALSSHSVGQHVRHIIELFQGLDLGYSTGIVNYESRQRDPVIESDKSMARDLLRQLALRLDRPDKELLLEASYDEHSAELIHIKTNFYRELSYNLEHTIHHMALIRIGISEVSSHVLSPDYGVASSTIKYRRQCAQ